MDWIELEAEYRQEATADFSTGNTAGSKRYIGVEHGLALMREAGAAVQDALGNLTDARRPGRTAELLAEYARRAKTYKIKLRVLNQLVNDRAFNINPIVGTQGDYDSNRGLCEGLGYLHEVAENCEKDIIQRWTQVVRSEAGF